MDEYIVSARKYRPMTFDTVVGQVALTTTLKNAVKSTKLAHAYLFCGPRGVGKTTCARIFAKAINCMSPSDEGEACGKCESCIAFDEQRSLNIFELDAASNNSVEDIRGLMEQTRIAPQFGKYKVFIIDEVHMLSTAAFNAFLKTLEEPPAHVIFILATTEKHKVLPTIISRCQIYDFERITVPDIIDQLKKIALLEGINVQERALSVIAEKAEGGLRDALSLFDKVVSYCQGDVTYEKVIEDLNVLDEDNYFSMVDLCLENKIPQLMSLLEDIISKGFDGANVIGGLAKHVRNIMMAKNPETIKLLQQSEQQKQKFQLQANKCPTPFLYKALKIMNDCDVNYRQSNNKRLLVELTLIEVAQITCTDDDSEASGRSPKKLKPIFNKITSSTTKEEPIKESTHIEKPNNLVSGIAPKQEDIDNKPLKLEDIGSKFSIRKPKIETQTIVGDNQPIENNDERKTPFNQEELSSQWLLICNHLKDSNYGLSVRVKNLEPRIIDYPQVEIIVDNKILLEELKKVVPTIEKELKQSLKNSEIKLNIRLAKPNEIKPVLTNKERFDELRRTNKVFDNLVEQLDLELL